MWTRERWKQGNKNPPAEPANQYYLTFSIGFLISMQLITSLSCAFHFTSFPRIPHGLTGQDQENDNNDAEEHGIQLPFRHFKM